MRILLIAISFLFLTSVSLGQTPLARRAFDEATRLANTGEFGRALKAYRAASVAAEDDTGEFAIKVRYNLGVCYYRTGQLTAAVRELNAAIRLSKGRHQRAYYALGMTESALENWSAARTAFLALLEIDPRDGEAWFDLAFVYLAERNYDQAAAAFRKSIDNRSVDSALGHNNLGVIMAMRYEFGEAEKAFTAALAASGGRLMQARRNLEFCKTLQGNRTRLIAGANLKFTGRAGRLG